MQIPDEQTVETLIDWLTFIKSVVIHMTYNLSTKSDLKTAESELRTAIMEVNLLWPNAVSYNQFLPPSTILPNVENLIRFFEAINEDTSKAGA